GRSSKRGLPRSGRVVQTAATGRIILRRGVAKQKTVDEASAHSASRQITLVHKANLANHSANIWPADVVQSRFSNESFGGPKLLFRRPATTRVVDPLGRCARLSPYTSRVESHGGCDDFRKLAERPIGIHQVRAFGSTACVAGHDLAILEFVD